MCKYPQYKLVLNLSTMGTHDRPLLRHVLISTLEQTQLIESGAGSEQLDWPEVH